MRTVALIQARLGSTRLPCKTMLSLHGLPVIDWAELIDEVVVATSHRPENDVLEYHLSRQGVAVFRGPEDDVLERFRLAGAAHGAEQVVRICADNPLIWGPAIDDLIRFWRAEHAAGACDYAYNHIPRGNTYPDGLGAETLSAWARKPCPTRCWPTSPPRPPCPPTASTACRTSGTTPASTASAPSTRPTPPCAART